MSVAFMESQANWIDRVLGEENIYGPSRRDLPEGQRAGWRIAIEPYALDADVLAQLQTLGNDLDAFLSAAQAIYLQSLRDDALRFVREYLDGGKPEELVRFSQMRRLRKQRPAMLRPDLLETDGGLMAAEIDSVPGGFGELACLQDLYTSLGGNVVGGPHGVLDAFYAAMQEVAGRDDPTVGIVVSDESADYRPEMEYLARRLRERGRRVQTVGPRDIEFREDGLYLEGQRIDVLYRFFELFDLRNVPKADLFLYAQRKGVVEITPPIKPQFEEKAWFALLHHPALATHWRRQLGAQPFERLQHLIPRTVLVDPRPVPPHAQISGLQLGGAPVQDFAAIAEMTKRQREGYLLKASGFNEIAWGSHSVVIGEDHPASVWAETVQRAMHDFPAPLWLLQEFHKAKVRPQSYFDFARGEDITMDGRTRLCPYYFRHQGEMRLGGVLATVCPADKKLIHGMVDAVMLPAGI